MQAGASGRGTLSAVAAEKPGPPMSAGQAGGAPARRGGILDGRRWADAQAAPWPFIRWLAVVALMIGRWAAGIPATVTGWLGVLAVAGALILPDVAGIAFAGVRVELRRVRERQVETEREVAGLRQEIHQMQIQQASAQARSGVYFGDESIRRLFGGAGAVRAGEDAGSTEWPAPAATGPGDVSS